MAMSPDELRQENEELTEKLSDAEYDLDSLKTDLKPLDDMMYGENINEYEDLSVFVLGLQEKIEELKVSVQSTGNYWKSKYENEVETNKMLMEAIEANSTD